MSLVWTESWAAQKTTTVATAAIQSQAYEITVVRRSISDVMYLLEAPKNIHPVPGKLILLREGAQLVMAFRILKVDPEKNQILAKRVKRYGDYYQLNAGDTYLAVEKAEGGGISSATSTAEELAAANELMPTAPATGPEGTGASSRTLPPPPPSDDLSMPGGGTSSSAAEDLSSTGDRSTGGRGREGKAGAPPTGDADFDHHPKDDADPLPPYPEGFIESIRPYDPELDSGSSPSPSGDGFDSFESSGSKRGRNLSLEDDEDGRSGRAIEDFPIFDNEKNWLTGGIAYVRNANQNETASYYSGLGLRYGRRMLGRVFFGKKHVQDTLTLEGGGYFYKIVGFSNPSDSYDVASFIGTLRYNLMFSENFGTFFYGGISKGVVLSATEADPDDQALLSLPLPAGGGGFLFRFGPSWFIRVDIGLDVGGVGLTLKF